MSDRAVIDFHSHFVPEVLADSLRSRKETPRVKHSADGKEQLHAYREILPFASDIWDLNQRIKFMDRMGISTQVLSLPGLFGVDSLPLDEVVPLVTQFNNALAEEIKRRPARFSGLASLPLDDTVASVSELKRAVQELGFVGAILPADGFLTRARAEAYEPVLETAEQLGAHIFIHPGPVPERQRAPDAGHIVDADRDNANQRHIVLNVQALLSEVVVTLTMTDLLDAYPNLTLQIANLGGTIPFVIERMDEVSRQRFPKHPLPSTRMGRIFVDTSSFGPAAIFRAAEVFGTNRLLFGTDCPIFSTEHVIAAIETAFRSEADRDAVFFGNGQKILKMNARN